jgi:hypothetical protein
MVGPGTAENVELMAGRHRQKGNRIEREIVAAHLATIPR